MRIKLFLSALILTAVFAGVGLYSYNHSSSTPGTIAELKPGGTQLTFSPATLQLTRGATGTTTLQGTAPSGAKISALEMGLTYNPEAIEITSITSPSLTTKLLDPQIDAGDAVFAFGLTLPNTNDSQVCSTNVDANNSGSCVGTSYTCVNYTNSCTKNNVCLTPFQGCENNQPLPENLVVVNYQVLPTAPLGATLISVDADSQLALTSSNSNELGNSATHTLTIVNPFLPGDLNESGSVDIYDFNLLITKFGNPYTIYDFNHIISNFGKSSTT